MLEDTQNNQNLFWGPFVFLKHNIYQFFYLSVKTYYYQRILCFNVQQHYYEYRSHITDSQAT